MGIHEIPKRDRSVWWLWVGILALVALLIYVAMSAFSTSPGAPVAKADQGIEVDADGWQTPSPAAPKASRRAAPVPAPTITLQGLQTTLPRVTVTRDVEVPVPVPGPTAVVTPPAATVTKTVNARPKPAPTVTKTVTAPAPTVTVTETVTAPAPTVTITIYVPLFKKPKASPFGSE